MHRQTTRILLAALVGVLQIFLPDAVSANENEFGLKQLQEIQDRVDAMLPKVLPAVVSIGETASGVIVKPEGIIITASHVTGSAGRGIDVRLANGRVVRGITLGSNAANDTSAIRLLEPGPYPFLMTVARSNPAQKGQWCVALGYPFSWSRDSVASPRLGRITGQYKTKIVTDCPIMGGDSGGPLLDLNGNIVALNSSVRLDITQNLHVPIQRYRDDWRAMMASRDIDQPTVPTNSLDNPQRVTPTEKKPYIGVYAQTVTSGVQVRTVRRGSPAQFAGIRADDVIESIDGVTISNFATLVSTLKNKSAGQQVSVLINRYGTRLIALVEVRVK